MPTSLSQRISAEFDEHNRKKKEVEKDRERLAQEHEKRLADFARTCDELKEIWRPRLEEVAKQFGDKIKVTPNLSPSRREARVVFKTDLANITLTLTVSSNADVSMLVLDYDLLVIPVYFQYERHARLEMPLDEIDTTALGEWLDDRLVSCVKTYLAIQANELYIKRAMVEDPISKTKFLREDAVAKIVHNKQTQYFLSEETLDEYAKKHEIEVVKDPITGDRFVRENAVATIEYNGQELFFISGDTLEEFEQKHQIKS